jgi:hypothetical protein
MHATESLKARPAARAAGVSRMISRAGLLCLAVTIPLACSTCSRHPYFEQEISGPLTTSTEWVVITPKEPLAPERERHEVILYFSTPQGVDHKTPGIRSADGSVFTPEVQLVDTGGNVFTLNKITALDPTGIGLSMRNLALEDVLPVDKTYPTVRLRSSRPLSFSRILWRCYNPQDMK